ncbi:MAG: hypothetical protein LUD72_01485 [Bacteroidales bacterium]|nr:hypothetical protein [Bacteroidales bacterium]
MTIGIDINDVIRDFTRQFIECYRKGVDVTSQISYDDVDKFDFFEVFPFKGDNGMPDRDFYMRFRYEDFAYELHCRADFMDRNFPAEFSIWSQSTMRDFDEDRVPELMIVAPFEGGATIPATLAFLSKTGCKVRNLHFPTNSMTVWDKCDVVITANPSLIENAPEDKVAIKIWSPYNKDVECKYEFESFSDLMLDDTHTLQNIINNYFDKTEDNETEEQ